MGKVKEILQEQDKEFISLHDLLTRIAAVTGDSYQDAAILLYRLLPNDIPEDLRLDIPQFTYDSKHGMQHVDEEGEWYLLNCLQQAAESGIPPDDPPTFPPPPFARVPTPSQANDSNDEVPF